ncbi:MAG: hypothetical protein M4579_000941 [Chaenotheca gracillima]|nr:MAG: hypothetical protein M4579_000941 [Chaenotheca gracillima]
MLYRLPPTKIGLTPDDLIEAERRRETRRGSWTVTETRSPSPLRNRGRTSSDTHTYNQRSPVQPLSFWRSIAQESRSARTPQVTAENDSSRQPGQEPFERRQSRPETREQQPARSHGLPYIFGSVSPRRGRKVQQGKTGDEPRRSPSDDLDNIIHPNAAIEAPITSLGDFLAALRRVSSEEPTSWSPGAGSSRDRNSPDLATPSRAPGGGEGVGSWSPLALPSVGSSPQASSPSSSEATPPHGTRRDRAALGHLSQGHAPSSPQDPSTSSSGVREGSRAGTLTNPRTRPSNGQDAASNRPNPFNDNAPVSVTPRRLWRTQRSVRFGGSVERRLPLPSAFTDEAQSDAEDQGRYGNGGTSDPPSSPPSFPLGRSPPSSRGLVSDQSLPTLPVRPVERSRSSGTSRTFESSYAEELSSELDEVLNRQDLRPDPSSSDRATGSSRDWLTEGAPFHPSSSDPLANPQSSGLTPPNRPSAPRNIRVYNDNLPSETQPQETPGRRRPQSHTDQVAASVGRAMGTAVRGVNRMMSPPFFHRHDNPELHSDRFRDDLPTRPRPPYQSAFREHFERSLHPDDFEGSNPSV